MVKDLKPGSSSSAPSALVAAGPLVFFAAQGDDAGNELWATDGTAAGTRRVKDIAPGGNSGIPSVHQHGRPRAGRPLRGRRRDHRHRAVAERRHRRRHRAAQGHLPRPALLRDPQFDLHGTRVFFAADDGVHGRELWTSDGTAAGTGMVEDILPGPGSSVPRELAVVDGLLLFAAHDGVHGVEPWASNGTAAGTFRIQDIAPGPLPSSPLAFHPAGPNVYFAATDAHHRLRASGLCRGPGSPTSATCRRATGRGGSSRRCGRRA